MGNSTGAPSRTGARRFGHPVRSGQLATLSAAGRCVICGRPARLGADGVMGQAGSRAHGTVWHICPACRSVISQWTLGPRRSPWIPPAYPTPIELAVEFCISWWLPPGVPYAVFTGFACLPHRYPRASARR